MWFVYLLESSKTKIKYTGSTNNLKRRLLEHNNGISKFTSTYCDWKIIYFKEFNTENEARLYERRIKKNKRYRQEFYLEAKLNKL